MSEQTTPGAARTTADERMSRALVARVAAIARRVAAVVEQRCGSEPGATSTVTFLRDWAATAPVPGIATAPSLPLPALTRRLGLTAVEVDLLLLAGLPEEHEGLAAALRRCHPRSEPRPTVGLAALVVEPAVPERAALRRVLHEGRAAASGALVVDGSGPFFERSLLPADGLWDALHGHDAWPPALQRVDLGDPPPGLDGWLELPAVRRAVAALAAPDPVTLVLSTADHAIAAGRCAALARAAGTRAVAARGADAVRLLAVHAAARAAVPVVVVDPAEPDRSVTVDLDGLPGPVVVCAPTGAVRPGPHRPVLAVPVGPVGVADRRAAWRAALPDRPELAPTLAARHPLDPAVTAQVARDVAAHARLTPGPVDLADVSATIRARAGATLPAGVTLVVPRVDGPQLVLGPEQTAQLRDAVARLENQATVIDDWGLRADRGVRLLFTGPPGTGKSVAAEALAASAGTDLLVVDVSRVVSKWIGETEKNLAAAFDVAERTQAVLLLDEADALFATRTEIADSHDRYANLETAYLLQRLDRFDGLAVLATNLRQNIDPAFVRRMDYVVEFPLPDSPSRALLWERLLPERRRGADVDLRLLAHVFPVPGGWIRNAAIEAAFHAAGDGSPVTHDHLVAAMRREYAKASRPFPAEAVRRPTTRDDDAVRVIAAHARAMARTQPARVAGEEER
jgi:MoxR-like ATPase